MARRKKQVVRVDFSSTAPVEPKVDLHAEEVREVWMRLDGLHYVMKELLRSRKKRDKRKWIADAKEAHRRLGEAMSKFKIIGDD